MKTVVNLEFKSKRDSLTVVANDTDAVINAMEVERKRRIEEQARIKKGQATITNEKVNDKTIKMLSRQELLDAIQENAPNTLSKPHFVVAVYRMEHAVVKDIACFDFPEGNHTKIKSFFTLDPPSSPKKVSRKLRSEINNPAADLKSAAMRKKMRRVSSVMIKSNTCKLRDVVNLAREIEVQSISVNVTDCIAVNCKLPRMIGHTYCGIHYSMNQEKANKASASMTQETKSNWVNALKLALGKLNTGDYREEAAGLDACTIVSESLGKDTPFDDAIEKIARAINTILQVNNQRPDFLQISALTLLKSLFTRHSNKMSEYVGMLVPTLIISMASTEKLLDTDDTSNRPSMRRKRTMAARKTSTVGMRRSSTTMMNIKPVSAPTRTVPTRRSSLGAAPSMKRTSTTMNGQKPCPSMKRCSTTAPKPGMSRTRTKSVPATKPGMSRTRRRAATTSRSGSRDSKGSADGSPPEVLGRPSRSMSLSVTKPTGGTRVVGKSPKPNIKRMGRRASTGMVYSNKALIEEGVVDTKRLSEHLSSAYSIMLQFMAVAKIQSYIVQFILNPSRHPDELFKGAECLLGCVDTLGRSAINQYCIGKILQAINLLFDKDDGSFGTVGDKCMAKLTKSALAAQNSSGDTLLIDLWLAARKNLKGVNLTRAEMTIKKSAGYTGTLSVDNLKKFKPKKKSRKKSRDISAEQGPPSLKSCLTQWGIEDNDISEPGSLDLSSLLGGGAPESTKKKKSVKMKRTKTLQVKKGHRRTASKRKNKPKPEPEEDVSSSLWALIDAQSSASTTS